MDQFVTTYRKDYLWPYIQSIGFKPEPEKLFQPKYRDPSQPCECHCLEKPRPTAEQYLGPPSVKEEGWTRMGPMGPLLDPKIYPAKTSEAPQSNISNFNQPNVFLTKLKDKYPFLYECLRGSPPDDMISRINRDRIRTTYQVDFGKMKEYPNAPYDELLRAANVEGEPPCVESINLPGDFYRPGVKLKNNCALGSNKGDSWSKSEDASRYCVGVCKPPFQLMNHGCSEYQDSIARLGTLIIRDGIHQKHRVPGRLTDGFMLKAKQIN